MTRTTIQLCSKLLIGVFIISHLLPFFSPYAWADTMDTSTSTSSLSSDSSALVLDATPSASEDSSSTEPFLSPQREGVSDGASSTPLLETASTTASTTNTTPVETSFSSSTPTSSTSDVATTTSVLPVDASSSNATSSDFGTVSSTSSTTPGSTTIITSTSTENEDGASSTAAEASSTEDSTLPEGTTTIATGNAAALANLLTIVNTSLVNSTGSIVLQNLTNGTSGDIDVRPASSTASSSCTLLACNDIQGITLQSNATGTIDNTVTLTADTGNNAIATAQNAIIDTGSAFTGLNLINIANTSLVDSTYLLLGLNAFNDVNGDIVFPSLSNFFNIPSGISSSGSINLNNDASVSNTLSIQTDAGNNEATDTQSGIISTGNALSVTNVINAINGTYIGGNSVKILLKVTGSWLGEVFGAPDGIGFNDTANGKLLDLSTPGTLASSVQDATANILSTSTALINNQVNMLAETGNNKTKDTANAVITTGDAMAAANIINIANTNVIGRNWILAIINIFGNFHGNIAFGRPDLWIGAQVKGNPPVQNGTDLTYTLTVANRGDSSATNVTLVSDYDEDHLDILDSTLPYSDADGKVTFTLGNLAPGASQEIVFHARIKNASEGLVIGNISTVTERENDNNNTDNSDSVSIQTYVEPTLPGAIGGSSGSANQNDTLPGAISSTPITLQVERTTASSSLVGSGTKGEQTIIIRNLTAQSLPDTTFEDILIDPQNHEVQRQSYDLGTIKPFEEITISYDIIFGDAAKEGTYLLSSEIHYAPNQQQTFTSNGYLTYIKGKNTAPQIIGIATSTIPAVIKHNSPKPPVSVAAPAQHGSVLGAFAESFSPEIAYAQEAGGNLHTIDWNYWIAYLIIVLLIAAALLYRRYLALRKNA